MLCTQQVHISADALTPRKLFPPLRENLVLKMRIVWTYAGLAVLLGPRTPPPNSPKGSSKRVSRRMRWKVGSLVPQISLSAMITWESRVSHSPGPSWGLTKVRAPGEVGGIRYLLHASQ